MTAPTIDNRTRASGRRATPPRRLVEANPVVLDGARLAVTCVLATLTFIGFTGIANQLAAVAPPPCNGPAPGLP